MAEEKKPVLASAGSVLRLIKLLAERGSLRVTEAARELGVSPSTSFRLLALMVQTGFAVQDANRAYLPGPAFVRLSLAPSAPDTLRVLVRSHLERTAQTVGETAHLMVLEGTQVRVLLSAEGPGALRVASREGALLPAHRTSCGKVLLAELAPKELGDLYPDGYVSLPRPPRTTLKILSRELEKVRRQRFAINAEQSEPGISAVGVALRHRSGAAVAAISISTPSSRFRKEHIGGLVEALHDTANRITDSM